MLSKCGSPPPARNLSLSISDRVEVRTKSMDDSESRSSPDGEVPVVRTMLEFCKIGSVCSNVEADIVLCWLERQHWVPGYGTLCKRCTYLCRDEKKKESGDGEFETIGSQGTLLIGEDTLDLPQGYTAFLQQDKDGPLGGDSGTNIECQPHEHKGSGNESRDIGLPQFAAKDVRNGGSERCVCCTWKLLAVQDEESNKAKGYDEGGVERKEVPGLKGAEEASPATGLSIAYGVGRVLMKLLLHCGRDEQGNRLANKQRPGAAGPSYASVKAAADGVPWRAVSLTFGRHVPSLARIPAMLRVRSYLHRAQHRRHGCRARGSTNGPASFFRTAGNAALSLVGVAIWCVAAASPDDSAKGAARQSSLITESRSRHQWGPKGGARWERKRIEAREAGDGDAELPPDTSWSRINSAGLDSHWKRL